MHSGWWGLSRDTISLLYLRHNHNHFSCRIFFCLIPLPIPQYIVKCSNAISSITSSYLLDMPHWSFYKVVSNKTVHQEINTIRTGVNIISQSTDYAFFSETLYCLMKNGRVCGQATEYLASIYFGIPASLNSPSIFCWTRRKFTAIHLTGFSADEAVTTRILISKTFSFLDYKDFLNKI